MKIGFVTDSTAYLPEDLQAELGIEVVPVQVVVSGASFAEDSGVSATDVISAVNSGKSVTTSRPSVAEFISVYQKLIAQGCDRIISLHLSAELSGTYETAVLAKIKSALPVEVIDSRTIGLAMGYALAGSAKMAAQGSEYEDVLDCVIESCRRSKTFFYVDTLDFLVKGGRVNKLQLRIGSAIALKPLLSISDGEIGLAELSRNTDRSLTRLVELATKHYEPGTKFSVLHVAAPERAEKVAAAIQLAHSGTNIHVAAAGAVVAAHLGPGAIALSISPMP